MEEVRLRSTAGLSVESGLTERVKETADGGGSRMEKQLLAPWGVVTVRWW